MMGFIVSYRTQQVCLARLHKSKQYDVRKRYKCINAVCGFNFLRVDHIVNRMSLKFVASIVNILKCQNCFIFF
jgi:hypothetical protein